MTRKRLGLMLYFSMVAHKAACQTLSKAFLKSRWLSRRGRRSGKIAEVLLVLEIFLTKDSQVKICSVVLLPALKPACSSAVIFSACDFSLFRMMFTLAISSTEDVLSGFQHCYLTL